MSALETLFLNGILEYALMDLLCYHDRLLSKWLYVIHLLGWTTEGFAAICFSLSSLMRSDAWRYVAYFRYNNAKLYFEIA